MWKKTLNNLVFFIYLFSRKSAPFMLIVNELALLNILENTLSLYLSKMLFGIRLVVKMVLLFCKFLSFIKIKKYSQVTFLNIGSEPKSSIRSSSGSISWLNPCNLSADSEVWLVRKILFTSNELQNKAVCPFLIISFATLCAKKVFPTPVEPINIFNFCLVKVIYKLN